MIVIAILFDKGEYNHSHNHIILIKIVISIENKLQLTSGTTAERAVGNNPGSFFNQIVRLQTITTSTASVWPNIWPVSYLRSIVHIFP